VIAGTFLGGGAHDIEARFNGGSWVTVAEDAVGSFSGTLTGQAAGQGDLEVRFVDDVNRNYTVPHVAVADIFVIAGQSNASGYTSAAMQTYSHATLKAGLFGNDYRWKELIDPVDSPVGQIDTVSQDDAAVNGTLWPLLATQIMAATGLPVAFVPCPMGGTPIEWHLPGVDHQDRTMLYGSTVYRALQVGGVKAVLFHQKESDATVNGFTGGVAYKAMLIQYASAIADDLGVKVVAALIHKWDGAPLTTQENVDELNQATVDAIDENPDILLLGPDFDSPTRVTDNLHFYTVEHLQEAADRWFAALDAAGLV
jgi:hypothetical protein